MAENIKFKMLNLKKIKLDLLFIKVMLSVVFNLIKSYSNVKCHGQ